MCPDRCAISIENMRLLPAMVPSRNSIQISLLCFFLLGCNPPQRDKLETLNNIERECAAAYLGTNANLAAEAVLRYRSIITDYQKEGVQGLRYDYLMAVAAGRLFFLNKHIGNTNQASAYLSESIHYFRNAFPNIQPQSTLEEEEKVKNFIHRLDGKRALWMQYTNESTENETEHKD